MALRTFRKAHVTIKRSRPLSKGVSDDQVLSRATLLLLGAAVQRQMRSVQ